jgi:hypothetical protein
MTLPDPPPPDDHSLSPAEEISAGSVAPNSLGPGGSDSEESRTEVHDDLLEIDPIFHTDQNYQTRVKNVRAFVTSELKRIRRDSKRVSLTEFERRELSALAAAPGCTVKKRLFILGLYGRPHR